MSRGTLLIRADADHEIGTGHVMRCLALAQAWQDAGGDILWACHALPAALEERLRAEKMAVERVDAGAASLEAVVGERTPNWVILDGRFDVSHQRASKRRGASVLVVDDDASLAAYELDLLVDHNLFADASRYPTIDPQRVLTGPRYALLRREITEQSLNRSRVGSHVLLTFGGADPARLALVAVDALRELSRAVPALEATLLLGPATPHKAAVEERARSLPFLRLVCDAVNMRPHLVWADIAVVAAGGTCLELAYAGVPMLAVVTADNQRRVAAALAAHAVARSLGEARGLDARTLACAIRDLLVDSDNRARMARAGATLVDGRGAERVIGAMEATT